MRRDVVPRRRRDSGVRTGDLHPNFDALRRHGSSKDSWGPNSLSRNI